MSTIRLEHEKFVAAPLLAVLLSDRMLTVSDASGDAAGDVKSTTFVCSAAYEASIGGESAGGGSVVGGMRTIFGREFGGPAVVF